ncbi:ABC transporter substrate-binding protein [Scatolibacter rhodanostii]|uniref:ABC transporter substrate-binding protein n=1 Tax=Scatolibacter rhodanostii TaxID=2014781 RepID=UPI000C07A353|nr:ABC transporter substrate-binding protein [Scatolibacter rhodanostii]
MKKMISTTLATLTLVAALASCGNNANTSGAKESETGSSDAKTSDVSTSSATDVFKVGAIGPLTGPAAAYGISVKQGAQIAIDEINAAGGVTVGDKTYSFEMIFEDDEATEDKAIQAYNTVMDKGINVLMGAVTSGSSIAIADLTKADGIMQLTPSASAENAIKNDNAFRICFSDPEQGVAMADYMIDTLGKTKVAVIYNNADEYSTGLGQAFEEEVAAKGGTVVTSEAFATGDMDFSSQLTKIKGTDAEIIYIPAYYQDATYITKQAKEMGITLPFIGSDGWDGVLGTVTDTTTVEGAIFSAPFSASVEDDHVKTFVDAYKKAYSDAVPDQFAADGYDSIYTFKAAMEKASSIESADLIAAMTEITVNGLTGDNITFDASGAAKKEVRYVKITDGAYAYA